MKLISKSGTPWRLVLAAKASSMNTEVIGWRGVCRALLLGFVVLGISCVSGCGGAGPQTAEDWSPTDLDDVRHVVSEVSGARSQPEKLAEVFATVPGEDWLKAAGGKSFELIEISVDGDEAIAKMSIQDFDGNVLSEQDWRCTRSGDQWKVADAPLGQ